MDQPKIERLLRLMKMMSGSVNYSIDELSDKLDMSPRTIYRYIDTFKNAGFAVQRIDEGVYKMTTYNKELSDLSQLVYFSEEEAIARIEEAERDLKDPSKWVTSEQMWENLYKKYPWLK